jgi:hypothetical protein
MIRKMLVPVVLVTGFFTVAGSLPAKTISHEESSTIAAGGIRTVSIRDIRFTEIRYQGSPGSSEFTVSFQKKANGSGDENLENILSDIRLETEVKGGTLVITLRSPTQNHSGVLDRWFNHKSWSTVLEIKGPEAVNLDIAASFSELRTTSTAGSLSLSTDFSTSTAADHEGRVQVRSNFGSFNGENIRGSFDIDSEFSRVSLNMTRLDHDSRASVSFSHSEIGIPKNTGATFRMTRNFGGVTFATSGALSGGEKGALRTLNGGGSEIALDTQFGSIRIHDTAGEYSPPARAVYRQDRFMPLSEGAWWEYAKDDEARTLRVVRVRAENGRSVATLAFDKPEDAPFGSIDVFETEKGLFLSGINRSFFGKNLSGILMNPPVLWLPYRQEDSPSTGGDITGKVRITAYMDTVATPAGRMDNVISYSLEGTDRPPLEVRLVPGVGFISFNGYTLVSFNLSGGEEHAVSTPQAVSKEPRFEKGVVRSVEIHGARMRDVKQIRRKLDITEGNTYSREQIDKAIKELGEDPLIDYASYTIDIEGRLHVTVYEIKPFTKDIDLTASYTRVGGLGLGPTLKITSIIGPISEVHGGAEYHWGTKDWTWEAGASRSFFPSKSLTIGGGYRNDFESSMEWAIPHDDAYLNAFLLGEETANYSHVESAYGYITQNICNFCEGSLRYFEDTYSSAGKETDWSLFNRNRVKEENPPLSAGSAVKISGARLTITHREVHTITDFRSKIEIERTYQKTHHDYPAYTRILGLASWNLQYWYDNLVKFRVAGGYSNQVLPDEKSFRLGGLNTLRGFRSMSIPLQPSGQTPYTTFAGGEKMLLANFDYFWGDELSLIFFGDIGGVWRKGEPVTSSSVKRDLGIGLAFGSDFFSAVEGDEHKSGFRVNWAVPVGNEPHHSHWTVNFVRAY